MSYIGNSPTDKLVTSADLDPAFFLPASKGGSLTPIAVTGNGTGTVNTLELCSATSAIVRTIPTGTVVGDAIGYKDNGQMFATYSLTITPPSGHAIEDLAADETLVVTTNYLAFTLRQVSSGLWRIF